MRIVTRLEAIARGGAAPANAPCGTCWKRRWRPFPPTRWRPAVPPEAARVGLDDAAGAGGVGSRPGPAPAPRRPPPAIAAPNRAAKPCFSGRPPDQACADQLTLAGSPMLGLKRAPIVRAADGRSLAEHGFPRASPRRRAAVPHRGQPGELADYILLPQDQDRVRRIACFDTINPDYAPRVRRRDRRVPGPQGHRPVHGSTRQRRDRPRRDPQICGQPPFIRIRSVARPFRKRMELGDLVISTGSVRLETTTSSTFIHEGGTTGGRPTSASLALEEAATRTGHRHHPGPDGYRARPPESLQGRPILNPTHPLP